MAAKPAADEGASATGVGAKAAFIARAERDTLESGTLSAARLHCHKHLRKAIAAFKRADYGKAAMRAVDATEADPGCGQAFHMLALALDSLGDMSRAIQMYERAYQLDPDDSDLYLNLGLAAWRIGMNAVAEKFFRLYCELAPDQPMGWNNLSGVLRDASRFDEAIEICRATIMRMPEQPLLWNTLGTILVELCDFAQAAVFYREALRLDPHFARAWHNLGYGLHHTGSFEEALSAYDHALSLTMEPRDRIETQHARALCLLSMGRVGEGFAEYEIRHHKQHRASTLYGIDAPLWCGEPLDGRSLLVMAEQGLGDEVMFANILPDLQAAVGETGRLMIAADTRLSALLGRSFPRASVGYYVIKQHNAKDVRLAPWAGKPDFVTPMGSALAHLRPSLESFPGRTFLMADPIRVGAFRAHLAARPGLKVGLCWRSMMINAQRQKYFSAIDDWAPVFKVPGVSFVNLQYGEAAGEIARAKALFGVDFEAIEGLDLKNDLDGAAALSAACDLVIAAPTAAAALAAAIGTETWFLLAGQAWPQLGTDHYPWYRASRAFSPAAFADWAEVMPRIGDALAARAP